MGHVFCHYIVIGICSPEKGILLQRADCNVSEWIINSSIDMLYWHLLNYLIIYKLDMYLHIYVHICFVSTYLMILWLNSSQTILAKISSKKTAIKIFNLNIMMTKRCIKNLWKFKN